MQSLIYNRVSSVVLKLSLIYNWVGSVVLKYAESMCEGFLDPSDSYFLFADLVGFYTH
jgi:hypothetical protein